MRFALLFLLALPGCVQHAGDASRAASGKTARILASLVETAARNREARLDDAHAKAAADSVLRSESVTADEFRSEVRALNRDVTRWREVSEDAARALEQRLAARGGAR